MVETHKRRLSRHERKQSKKARLAPPDSNGAPADSEGMQQPAQASDQCTPKTKRKRRKTKNAAAEQHNSKSSPQTGKQARRRLTSSTGAAVQSTAVSPQAAQGPQKKRRTARPSAAAQSPEVSELFKSLAEAGKGTLSDRLNPTHPHYDKALRKRWKSFTKQERAAIVACDKNRLQAMAKAIADINHPFPSCEDDHVETAVEAYRDIAPILTYLAKWLKKTPAELQIYDPFYCAGAVVVHLKELGFENVHHVCEDFYAVQREARVPPHDVLVTNPPYSGNHVERLLRWSRTNGKPFFLLMPNYFCIKPFYEPALGDASKVLYLFPRKRYKYWTPRALRSKEKVQTQHVSSGAYRTSPFLSFWHIDVSPVIPSSKLRSWWNSRPRGKHGTLSTMDDLPPMAFDAS